jgi:hypothetical protein
MTDSLDRSAHHVSDTGATLDPVHPHCPYRQACLAPITALLHRAAMARRIVGTGVANIGVGSQVPLARSEAWPYSPYQACRVPAVCED